MRGISGLLCGLVLAAALAAPAVAAPVTLVCDQDLDQIIIGDAPAILVIDEDAKTVQGHTGGFHYAPPAQGGVSQDQIFGPVPATFSADEIVFTFPGYIVTEHLSRLTGAMVNIDSKDGQRWAGGRKCHVQQKQF